MTDNIFDDIKVKFEQFILLVGTVLVNEKEIYIIQNKLRRHFNTTSSSYLCSTDFLSLLNYTHNSFNKNDKSTKYFSLLASFDEQLKKHSIKLLGSHRSANEASSSIVKIESINIASSITNEHEIKRKKKISKLERMLSSLSKTIRKLEEKDLSLDDMQYCDLYLIESKLKKRACEVFTNLAELKNQSSSAQRILDEPITLTETEIDHPLIRKALEDMVNQTNFLPSYDDVVDTVDKTNDKYELKLSFDVRKNIAEKSFKIIGTKVKNRRMADFYDIMNSRFPEDFDFEQNDPALNNAEIEKTLLNNKRQAVIRTEKIFEKFSQIDPNLEPEINIESSTENDEEDDEIKSESKTIIQPFDNKFDEAHYDIVDILPPFSPSNATETIDIKDPVKPVVEILLANDDTLYNIYNQRISSNDLSITQNRLSKEIDYSNCKKRKVESEIIIID